MIKNKIWFMWAIISSFTTLTAHAMEEMEIEFQWKRAPATTLINEAKENPKTHPFSATQLFQYDSSNYSNPVRLVGNICDISEKDLETIKQGDFIYCNSYRSSQTHFSGRQPVEIAAFILGTKNKRILIGLYNWRETPFIAPSLRK